MSYTTKAIIKKAIDALNRGNLPLADICCNFLLDNGIKHSTVYEILGHISSRIGAYEVASRYFQSAIDTDPHCLSAKESLLEVKKLLEQQHPVEISGDSYLLIKAWGYGFWSDVEHVLGQLLLAEITGRMPVVHWSDASLFSDGSHRNAFEIYFQPLTKISIDDLVNRAYSYFPKKWTADNLHRDGINKFHGQYSRMAGLYYLNRSENVLVSDFHTFVNDLRHWIPYGHHLYEQDCESIYRYLFDKYIELDPDINAEIESFRANHLVSNEYLGIHVRGSDKILESGNLAAKNTSYHELVDQYLRLNPDLQIFLLTDYEPALREFRERYPGKIVSTQCTRTEDVKGVHYEFQDNKVRNGIEVVKDAYLASGCKYFVGNGRSAVSTAIVHMKNWDKDHYTLIDGNRLYERDFFLHDW